MGNKNEKSSFDQELVDKLMEETGLEREVIIAWRFVVTENKHGGRYFDCLESNFYSPVRLVKWAEKISLNSIVHYVSNPKKKSKKSPISFLPHSIEMPTEKSISPNFSV